MTATVSSTTRGSFAETGPGSPVVESMRVDQVTPGARTGLTIRLIVAIVVAFIMLIPVIWIGMTAIKSRPDATAVPPIFFFSRDHKPSWDGFIGLFTNRTMIQSATELAKQRARTDLSFWEKQALVRGLKILGPSKFVGQLQNSLIISLVSTFLAVALGLLSAYAFSRWDIKGKGDWLFFILSTRMLPAVVVTIPIFLMYRALGLYDTHLGMIMLYTAFNLSFSVWLLKGFIDEIPREYEEAALVDGYSRMQAFGKIVLPQCVTGIAATAVFCLIFAWNEFAFSLMMTSTKARTAPPAIVTIQGVGGVEWGSIAAGSLLFLIPVVIVTFALRNYLLRGVTFGAIRQ
jgi:multiple sugar transport system permease protein